MRIIYTKHAAIDKFAMFRRHKFKVTKRQIKAVLQDPEHEDIESDPPKIIE